MFDNSWEKILSKDIVSFRLWLNSLTISFGILSAGGEEEVNIDFLTLVAYGVAIELESFSSGNEEK